MTAEEVLNAALEAGFTAAFPLDPGKLRFLPEVRDMCADGRCGNYNKSWSCPPACGTLEEIAARAGTYPFGVLLQTTAQLADSFDYEGIEAAQKKHKANLEAFTAFMKQTYPDVLPMGAGGCQLCKTCTYPSAPCRFPERMTVSMEAYGLLVSGVCADCGAPYYYGANTLTFAACVLYREPDFKSKQNSVSPCAVDGRPAVRKVFSAPGRLETEAEAVSALRAGGAAVPETLGRGDGYIVYERVSGPTLLETLEGGLFTADTAEALADWLVRCRVSLENAFGKPMILGDIHLANFILHDGSVYGVDFEECRPGRFEEDIGLLLAYIVTYDPAFSDYELSAAKALLEALRKRTVLDEKALASALDGAFALLFQRRGTTGREKDVQRVRAALGLC
ncbi:MAG: hypothetical protein IK136_02975 [Oscillospiraceae bacterium]|nr:hypothetical protein [Oscillospiraceae bacterium]